MAARVQTGRHAAADAVDRVPESRAPVGYTRRQAIRFGAGTLTAVGAAAVAGPLLGTARAASAVGTGAAAFEPQAVPATTPVSDLPVQFGSPTDLALSRRDQAWARETDGTVHRFDRARKLWEPTKVAWVDLLRTGSVILARWGQPSGGPSLVMVFGSAPPPNSRTTTPPPTSRATTSRPTTAPTSRPTTSRRSSAPSSRPTTTVTTTRASSATTTSATTSASTTSGPSTLPNGSGGGSSGPSGGGSLAYTGFDVERPTLTGLSAIVAGAILLLWARRRAVAQVGAEDAPPARRGRRH